VDWYRSMVNGVKRTFYLLEEGRRLG